MDELGAAAPFAEILYLLGTTQQGQTLAIILCLHCLVRFNSTFSDKRTFLALFPLGSSAIYP